MPIDQTVQMDVERMIGAVEAGGHVVAEAARGDLGAEIATCEGWTVEDLARHLGRVYRSVATIVSTRSQVMVPPEDTPSGPRGDAVVDWFEASHGLVTDALSNIDPTETLWTWAGLLPAQFYFRRMAHETAIHAFDAASASEDRLDLDSDLCADGVDEYFERVLPFTLSRWNKPLPEGSLHVHRTDGEGEWMLRLDGSQLVMTREHAKGDAALRGSGDALFLAVWNRLDVAELDSFGSAELIRAWAALAP